MRSTKSYILSAIICLIPFIIVFILTKLFLRDYWVFGWLVGKWYMGVWIIAVVMSWYKESWGYVISYSNLFSMIVGQVLGDIIYKNNLARITPEMDEKAIINNYPGYRIWIRTLLLCICIYAIICICQMIRKKKGPIE